MRALLALPRNKQAQTNALAYGGYRRHLSVIETSGGHVFSPSPPARLIRALLPEEHSHTVSRHHMALIHARTPAVGPVHPPPRASATHIIFIILSVHLTRSPSRQEFKTGLFFNCTCSDVSCDCVFSCLRKKNTQINWTVGVSGWPDSPDGTFFFCIHPLDRLGEKLFGKF